MSWEPINDAILALDVWRTIGYSQDTINLYLKQRWYDENGLVAEEEWRDYCRANALQNLLAHRRCRAAEKPTLATIYHRKYLSWRKEL